MCTLSLVFDHYSPLIPESPTPHPADWFKPVTITSPPIAITQQFDQKQIDDLKQLIKDFRDAVTAAKLVDKLIAQPDCEDPAKSKLLERVAALEKKIAALEKPKTKKKK